MRGIYPVSSSRSPVWRRPKTTTAGTTTVLKQTLSANVVTQETYPVIDSSVGKTGSHVHTFHDIGWTVEKAIEARGLLSSFAEDWDDPEMDVYNAYLDT